MAPVAVLAGVVAAVGIAIVAVGIGAVTSPAIVPPPAIAVAIVAIACRMVITMETTGTTGTGEMRNATGARMERTTGTSEMGRATEARMRRTTEARARRRTTKPRARRGTTEPRARRRRSTKWLGERGISRDYCSAEHHARGHGQKGLPQHGVSAPI
jgi:hypothetical protein